MQCYYNIPDNRPSRFQSMLWGLATVIAIAITIETIPIVALAFSVVWAVVAPFLMCKLGRMFLPTSLVYSAFFLWAGICNYLRDIRELGIEEAVRTNDIFAQVEFAAETPFYANGWIVGSVGALLLVAIFMTFAWSTKLYRR
ncbi:hypothetical protein ACR42D_15045 [Desulfovibrio caledoniensis]